MRVTIEHREQRGGFGLTKHAYFLDCTVDFSEEEKGIIKERHLEEHYVTLPKGYVAVLDHSEQTRLYALKVAIAAGFALVGIIWAGVSHGHPAGGVIFFGSCGYAVYCLVRIALPSGPEFPTLPISFILKHRRFAVRSGSPTRTKEIEDKILTTITQLKGFLDDSVELGARSVHEL